MDVQKYIKEYVVPDAADFRLISESTNKVYSFVSGGKKYILKFSTMNLNNLSPFWEQLRMVYQSDFVTQANTSAFLTLHLLKNPYIYLPEVVHADTRDQIIQIIEYINGKSYKPDIFPSSVCYQLGRYVGWFHSATFEGYGKYSENMNLNDCGTYIESCKNSMRSCIEKYWSQNHDVTAFFGKMESNMIETPSSFVLMMPDISANQFVYSDDLSEIIGLVDFDAYVVGRRELELAVVELCLSDHAAFIRGYEEHQAMPSIQSTRDFYRFMIYLNDPWDPMDFGRYISEKHYFQ